MSNDTDSTVNVTPLSTGGFTNYRTPPQNLELEQALLGAILVNNDAVNKVGDFLEAAHFFEPVHQRLYLTITKLIERGQIANPVTLTQYFERDDALSDVGGSQYLARLAGAAVTVINAEYYGRSIYDLAIRRELIGIGEDMVNEAYDADVDSSGEQQMEQSEQKLFDLAEKGTPESGFRTFTEAAVVAVEMADAAHRRDTKLVGVDTGLDDLNEKLGGLHPSDLLILAARPAMGKSALATNISVSAAKDGAVVAFFSLEMSAEQLATRVLAEESEVSSDRIRRGAVDAEMFARFASASKRAQDWNIHIDDTPALTIASLRSRARRLMRQKKRLDLVVVDYLQLLRPATSRVENRVQEISEITRGLKALAKELNVPVLALSQLSRAVEQREDKRPQLSDLRESGSIEQDSDVVMFIYREDYYHERLQPEPGTEEHLKWQEKGERIHGHTEIIIGKQRHGPTGTVRLHFNREFTKFTNWEHADYSDSNFS